MIVKVERFDTENVFLPVPDEILEKLNCRVGDVFHVAVVQPNCILLTRYSHDDEIYQKNLAEKSPHRLFENPSFLRALDLIAKSDDPSAK